MDVEVLKQEFKKRFGNIPEVIASAPGRVNLLGEHTDYNNGFVLPVAIDREVVVLAGTRRDDRICLISYDFDEHVSFCLKEIEYDPTYRWSNYQRGVAQFLQKRGYSLCGANLLLTGDIPIGAGLSSSAAVEIATALAFKALNNLIIADIDLITLCQQAENQFVGMNCGIMDQFVSCLGQENKALFLDCRSLEYQLVPFQGERYRIVIANTMVKRELVNSQYNQRRRECEQGVELLRGFLPHIKSLRDVSLEDFAKFKEKIPQPIASRVEHVLGENERVRQGVTALKEGDYQRFGELMNQSHHSLKHLYEVSCPELDGMVEIAQSVQGVLGARLTGAGFGGCTVNLVEYTAVAELKRNILRQYPAKTGLIPQVYVTRPAEGGKIVTKGGVV